MTTLEERARAWLLPVWRDMKTAVYTPTLNSLTALLTAVADEARAEERESCAAMLEARAAELEDESYIGKSWRATDLRTEAQRIRARGKR
jgi:hypothetical protein